MTYILALFQVKTVRSAWVFLLGSVVLFLWGIYVELFVGGPEHSEFELTFLGFWLAICLMYIVIAGWALFSKKGRSYLSEQELIPVHGNRTVAWFGKFLAACYGAAGGTWMLLSTLALPFAGFRGFELLASDNFWLYILLLAMAWAPILYRYLK